MSKVTQRANGTDGTPAQAPWSFPVLYWLSKAQGFCMFTRINADLALSPPHHLRLAYFSHLYQTRCQIISNISVSSCPLVP